MKDKENKQNSMPKSIDSSIEDSNKKNDIYDRISEIEGVGRSFQVEDSSFKDKTKPKKTTLNKDSLDSNNSSEKSFSKNTKSFSQDTNSSKKLNNQDILKNIKSNFDKEKDNKYQTKILKIALGSVFVLFIVSAAFMIWSLIESKQLKTEISSLRQDKSLELARYNNLKKKYNKNKESKKEISDLINKLKKSQKENKELKNDSNFYLIQEWGVKFPKNDITKSLIFAKAGGNDSIIFSSNKLSQVSEEKGEGDNKKTIYPCSINSELNPKMIVRKKSSEVKDDKDQKNIKIIDDYAYEFIGYDKKCIDKNIAEQDELNKSIRSILQDLSKI